MLIAAAGLRAAAASDRATMLFDAEAKLKHDPRGAERRLFAQVPHIQRGTY
jgi:para-nitrobenzyl esterase